MTEYRCTFCHVAPASSLQPTLAVNVWRAYCWSKECRQSRIFIKDDPDAAKAAGMAAVEQSAGQGVDAAWRAEAAAVARKLANQGEPFTAEDVVARVGPPAHHPNLVGALMNALRSEGLIEHAGFTKATRPESHARWIQVWRGRRAA